MPRLSTSARFSPFYPGHGTCRTNRNSLIAIGLGEIGFVSYFPPVPQRDVVLRRLPHHRRWVKYLPRTVKWLRAGNRAHPAGPRPDGHGSVRCSTPASSRFLPRATRRQSCPRRTNRNSLIAIGLGEIGFVPYFPPVPQRDVVLRGLPHHRRWVKYLPRTVKWLRAGNRCPFGGPAP